MIALLRGQIVCRTIDHLIIDVGGVGYQLFIPLSTLYALPAEGEACLHVHTHVKEDALHLYGFFTAEEKELFILLLSVSGVGPRLAVNILSNIPTPDLLRALQDKDSKRLSSVPGIGKKTAERLILELQEKARKLGPSAEISADRTISCSAPDATEDLVSALTNLGYKENLARKALESMEIPPQASLEEALKGALKILMK